MINAKINVIIVLMVLIACASCCPVSKEIIQQVDQTLTIKEVQQNIEHHNGKMILWGGVIIDTVNRPEETLVMVMQTSLNYEKRPINVYRSEGRFIAKQSVFLDPAIYAKDRHITVAGVVSGKEELPLGEIHYTYPVITATQLILWPKQEYPPYYYDPWYWEPYPLWWHHHYHYHRWHHRH